MAYTTESPSYTCDGIETDYLITFPFLDTTDIKVKIDGTTKDSSGKTPSQRHLSAYLLQHLEDQHNYGVANRPKSKINIDNEENERDEDDIVERRRRRDDIIPQTLNTDYA